MVPALRHLSLDMAIQSFVGEQAATEAGVAILFAFCFALFSFFLGRQTTSTGERPATTPVLRSALMVYCTNLMIVSVYYVLLFAVGVDGSTGVCRSATYAICTLNTISKLIMCNFYIERVLLAYPLSMRWKQIIYWSLTGSIQLLGICCITLTLYFAQFYISDVGACRSGVPRAVLVVVIVCDVGSEIALMTSFVYPIFVASFRDARPLAIKTSIGSFVTCCASVSNYLFDWFHHEDAKVWGSFVASTLPLIVNCVVVYALTTGKQTEAPGFDRAPRLETTQALERKIYLSSAKSDEACGSLNFTNQGASRAEESRRPEDFEDYLRSDSCVMKLVEIV